MSETGHEEEAGHDPQGPETTRIPVRPSSSADVPAWGQAGTLPLAPVPAEASAPAPAETSAQAVATAAPGAAAATAPDPEQAGGLPHRARLAFRSWRRSRPFWGGFLVLLGGTEILLTYRAAFGVVLHFGLYGLAGYLVPAMLTLLGLLILFDPAHRTFYSVLAVLAALGTWLTSNLGGFIIGMLLGVIGGSLAFGWQPGHRRARKRRHVRAGATG